MTRKRSSTTRDQKTESRDKKEFIVEKILSSRMRNRRLEYLLKWKGFDDSENSWEPAKNLDCPEMIKLFEENQIETETRIEETAKSYEIINEKYLVTDFLTRDSVQTGFEKGLDVEHILGATNVKGCLYLVLKFQGDNEPQLIQAEIVNQKIPQMVIKFYERQLIWESDDEEEEEQ
ncbi:chromobox protein homolog 3-like [Cochliomyia hominivorax]